VTSLQKVSAIQGGEAHTLVLTKEGKVLSFGAGTYGMLGR
jgi:regulator of chromosome condensation